MIAHGSCVAFRVLKHDNVVFTAPARGGFAFGENCCVVVFTANCATAALPGNGFRVYARYSARGGQGAALPGNIILLCSRLAIFCLDQFEKFACPAFVARASPTIHKIKAASSGSYLYIIRDLGVFVKGRGFLIFK